MKFDSDGEYTFIDGIKRTANLENGLDADIPAYLQLFLNFQRKRKKVNKWWKVLQKNSNLD